MVINLFLPFSKLSYQLYILLPIESAVVLQKVDVVFCLFQYMGGGPEPPLPLGAQEPTLVMNGKASNIHYIQTDLNR